MDQLYRIHIWGKHRPNDGVVKTLLNLTYQDVCGHIVYASRHDRLIDIYTEEGRLCSMGEFVLD